MRMEKELNADRQSMQQSIDAKQRLIEQQVSLQKKKWKLNQMTWQEEEICSNVQIITSRQS